MGGRHRLVISLFLHGAFEIPVLIPDVEIGLWHIVQVVTPLSVVVALIKSYLAGPIAIL